MDKRLNPCGRKIDLPHFSDARMSQMDLRNARNRQFVQRGMIVPPGVDVTQSPCSSYYNSRDLNQASDDCKSCIYDTWNYDEDCPCELKSRSQADLCNYASCVQDSYLRKNKCGNSYYAFYNVGDVQDNNYQPPFSFKDLKNCK